VDLFSRSSIMARRGFTPAGEHEGEDREQHHRPEVRPNSRSVKPRREAAVPGKPPLAYLMARRMVTISEKNVTPR